MTLRNTTIPAKQQHSLREQPSDPTLRALPDTVFFTQHGPRIALVLFFAASAQALLLFPYITLLPAERSNLFTALLCFLPLLPLVPQLAVRFMERRNAAILSLAMSALLLASGAASDGYPSSLFRAGAIVATSLSAYWSSIMLLDTPERRLLFSRFCLAGFILVLAVTTVGFIFRNNVLAFTGFSNTHSVAHALFLLSLGPLHFMCADSADRKLFGGGLLALAMAVLFACKLKTGIFAPLFLCFLLAPARVIRPRTVAALSLVCLAAAFIFFSMYPHKLFKPTKEQIPYHHRLENYRFNWIIAKANPILGIGLRADRTEYLESYEPIVPNVTPQLFAWNVKNLITAENIYLTFMSGAGFPFLILFGIAISIPMRRLYVAMRKEDRRTNIPMMAVFIPLSLTLLHMMVDDGLMHPQVCWYFFILLGLAPQPTGRTGQTA